MIIETQGATRSVPRARRLPRSARRRGGWVVVASVLYLIGVLGILSALRLMGDRHWIGTLMLFSPRWIYGLPLLAIVPVALVLRRWLAVGSCLIAAGILAGPIMGLCINWGSDNRRDVRLVSLNIHRQHLDAAKMAAFLDSVKPDVIAFQGWSDMHHESLFAGGGWHVLRAGELLIASRTPVKQTDVLELKVDDDVAHGEQGAAGLYEIETPRGVLHLINLHFASPHAGLESMWNDRGDRLAGNIHRRREESAKVRALTERARGPLVLAGDFNTPTDSPIFREAWQGFNDAFLSRGTGFGFTYIIRTTQLRIDHILGDAAIEFTSCWVGPDVNAAHRPLVADFVFR